MQSRHTYLTALLLALPDVLRGQVTIAPSLREEESEATLPPPLKTEEAPTTYYITVPEVAFQEVQEVRSDRSLLSSDTWRRQGKRRGAPRR